MKEQKNILVIDDDLDIGFLLKDYLSDQGYTVHTTASGKGGLDQLKAHNADIVLCDYRLPDVNGV